MYQVVEHAGTDNPKLIQEFSMYDDALVFLFATYSPEEIEEFDVDILNNWSPEF